MSEERFFLDTYALFEILEGNPAYEKFEAVATITTVFNLAEFNFALKREAKPFADEATRKLEPLLVEVTINDIIEAMNFRLEKRKLSIPDAIGYAVAKRCKTKFLTGDKEFEKMPNVEFVK